MVNRVVLHGLAIALLCICCVVRGENAASSQAGDAVSLVGPASPWRVYSQLGPSRITKAIGPTASKPNVGYLVITPLAQPPAEAWANAAYDDQHWARVDKVSHVRTGASHFRTLGIYGRTYFGISDPTQVQGLTLKLQYRGGVVIYLNGKEIARRHMPEGKIEPGTHAVDYPVEAFAIVEDPLKVLPEKRIRSADIEIPSSALVKGTNVLAIENHRAPYREEGCATDDRFVLERSYWPTVGLLSASLSATSPAGVQAAPAPGPRVWHATISEPIAREGALPNPFEPLRTVTMCGPRGGVASGQVIVSAPSQMTGLTAETPKFVTADGVALPANSVRIRYGLYWDYPKQFAGLAETAPEAATIPVWLSVDVPGDAKPGIYRGQLQLKGPLSQAVPIELEVTAWKLPDTKDWKSWACIFQSPETLAIHYKVPLWSDAHFALIDQSMAYQAKLGQKVLVVHGVASSLLARKTMVLYEQKNGKVEPDFSAVEKYMALYKKHMGQPAMVMLQLWDANVDQKVAPSPDKVVPVTLRDGNGYKDERLPDYGQPGSDELWPAVIAGMKKAIKAQGWPESTLVLGLTQDAVTRDNQTAFFAKHFPDIPWFTYTHGSLPAKPLKLAAWISPGQGAGHSSGRGWRTPRGYPNMTNLRGHLDEQSNPISYRVGQMSALVEGANGIGGMGLDYWPVSADGKNKPASIFQAGPHFQSWFRIIRGAPRTLLAPGPTGPISTAMYENMLAGLQECQALIYVEENAKNPKLSPELAKRAAGTYDRLKAHGDLLNWDTPPGHGWHDEAARLYRIAAEIQATLEPSAK